MPTPHRDIPADDAEPSRTSFTERAQAWLEVYHARCAGALVACLLGLMLVASPKLFAFGVSTVTGFVAFVSFIIYVLHCTLGAKASEGEVRMRSLALCIALASTCACLVFGGLVNTFASPSSSDTPDTSCTKD